MGLERAHKGYEYQDLLTSYYILNEILRDYESTFRIDHKEYQGDKFDDLTIDRKGQLFKKQIKYSDDHTLSKPDLSTDGNYSLALDSLYDAWMASPSKDKIAEVRLCLAWNEPVGADILEVLNIIEGTKSFASHNTKLYNINVDKLWNGTKPSKNWRRLRTWSANVDKKSFTEFCNLLIIEVNLPKFSLEFEHPEILEQLLLKQADALGAGIFPNEELKPIELILRLSHLVRSARISGLVMGTADILNKLNIRRDFGSIKQMFPIDAKQNLTLQHSVSALYSHLEENPKTLLHGEPGSGKSWMVHNLTMFCKKKNIPVIKHYCYTDLEDDLQKERIKLNVFYGNLIADILQSYPELGKRKKSKFGSSFEDLNAILQAIEKETIIIIDGLDHINRIFEFRNYNDIAKQDIKIIDSLAKLDTSSKVKLLVTSQPVQELEPLSGFASFEIPAWSVSHVKILMRKFSLKDRTLKDKASKLSDFLLERGGGNPLYTTFLIKEIRDRLVSDDFLNDLPFYSFNLESYYTYLLNRLNTKEQVPRVLSGVNFALTKTELAEITGDGDDVAESLDSLSAILKHNYSRDGYIIYHESFRRYILNTLKRKNIDIAKNIFKPVADWFDKKGLYSYQKSFRYYLPFLNDSGDYGEIIKHINIDFVFNSLINGQPWELIKINYNYLSYAASKIGKYTEIIIVSELNKIVSSTQDTFNDLYSQYIEALGNLKGYSYVNDALSFEGKRTVDPRSGLEACYLCSINNFTPIWNLYIGAYFKKGKSIDKKDFHLYLRYCIESDDIDRISKIAKQIEKNHVYRNILRTEILKVDDVAFIKKYESIPEIKNLVLSELASDSSIDIDKVSAELLKSSYAYENEEKLIEDLLSFVRAEYHNKAVIDSLVEKFENINWFYNWLIFIIQFTALEAAGDYNEEKILKAFKYIIKDTRPFHGTPRTCDLYHIRHQLLHSFKSVFSYISSVKGWKDVIGIAEKLSEETTTSLQGSQGGPLAPEALFSLLKEFANSDNINVILEVLEKLEKTKSEYHLYSYIAEYNFILSQLYSKSGDYQKAQATFEMGVRYAIGYTFRKDITLTENILALENIIGLGDAFSLTAFKKSKLLVNAVVDHTDGRETKHYPITWFDAFYNNHPLEATLYLRHELKQTRLDWRLESSLLKAVHNAKNVNPLIRLFLLRTFVIEWSEEHLDKCLDVYELAKSSHDTIAQSFLSSIFTKSHADLRSTTGYSDTFISRISIMLSDFDGLVLPSVNNKIYKEGKKRNTPNLIEKLKKDYRKRESFSDMPLNEIKQYFKQDLLVETDINSLCYYFDQFDNLTHELKEVVELLTNRKGYNTNHIEKYEVLFECNKEAQVYYWICCFIFEKSTWYEDLSYADFFKRAHEIDAMLAVRYLRELIHNKLNPGFSVGLSGNLINAFIKIGFDRHIIEKMWHTLFEATSSRLPVLEEYDWAMSLSNDHEMDIDEIFICLLFTRFRSFTVERSQLTLGGISYLLHSDPEKMIKPLKWFLTGHDEYLNTILVTVLTMLYDYEKINPGYKENFVTEIESIYPQDYYLIDTVIELLYGKMKKKAVEQQSKNVIYGEMPSYDSFQFFSTINQRHELLCDIFPDQMLDVYMEHKIRFKEEYNDVLQLYYAQSNGIVVANIYFYDFILNEINVRLYKPLKSYKNQNDIFEDLTIPVHLLVGQANSGTHRPDSLPLPSNVKDSKDFEVSKGSWIRIAHFEEELTQAGRSEEVIFHKLYGRLYFDKDNDEVDNPFILRALPDLESYKHLRGDDNILALFFIERLRYFEDLTLIYPSPDLLNYLSLDLKQETDGIYAVNSEGEKIIKYQTWKSDYMGNGNIIGLKDEIPKNDGAELLLRVDYYRMLCSRYNLSPKYRLTPVNDYF